MNDKRPFLTFGAPRIEQDEIDEVVDTLRSGWLSTGPKVKRFEEDFKRYTGAGHAVAMHSCTAGLELALAAAGIGPGDEVITTPFTFAATSNVIIHRGAKPVFADVDPATMNIDPAAVERRITRRTKALIPVHFAGRPCAMKAITALARRHKLVVLQDAAHSLEARYGGRPIDAWGDLTAYSFYATKNLTTGEGGMVTTSRGRWADTMRIMCSHGLNRDAWKRYSSSGFRHYEVTLPGYKFNMMDMQAALGLHQLRKIERYLKIRERVWEAYDAAFAGLPLRLPARAESGTRHARHLYTPLLENGALKIGRDEFLGELTRHGIGTSVHFVSMHLQPYYRKTFGYRPKDFPNAAFLSAGIFSLPLSAKLTDDDVDAVTRAVKAIVKRHKR